MDLNKILQELLDITKKINILATRSKDDYPLIPSNIVATKKVESLEKDLSILKKSNEIMKNQNQQLTESITMIASIVSSIDFLKKDNISENSYSEQMPEIDTAINLEQACITQTNSPKEEV